MNQRPTISDHYYSASPDGGVLVCDEQGAGAPLIHYPYHSTGGFDWGSDSDGALDLARAILLDHFQVIPQSDGQAYPPRDGELPGPYREFCLAFLAVKPAGQGFTITSRQIDDWVIDRTRAEHRDSERAAGREPRRTPALRTGARYGADPDGQVTVSEPDGQRLLRHYPYHSPTGFGWGYAGGGPADLARAILCDLSDVEPERKGKLYPPTLGELPVHYQDFKEAFIVALPTDTQWEIAGLVIAERYVRKEHAR